jgi:hypothetical protein
MKRKSIFFICLASMCMFAVLVVGAAAQQSHPGYPRMAPLSQYLMTYRAAEIALARSAAPAEVQMKRDVGKLEMCLLTHGGQCRTSVKVTAPAPDSDGAGMLFGQQRSPHLAIPRLAPDLV